MLLAKEQLNLGNSGILKERQGFRIIFVNFMQPVSETCSSCSCFCGKSLAVLG